MVGDYIILERGEASAAISRRGAEVRHWHAKGQDLLWDAEGPWWDKISPLLFPIVGRVYRRRLHIDGRTYWMNTHGFIGEQTFSIVERTPERVRLTASDTEATRENYPFPFRFDVTYGLTETGLVRTVEIGNPGDRDMPFSFGTHTGFAWPFLGGRQEDYLIEFEMREDPEIPVTTPNGLFAPEKRLAPLDGKRLSLAPQLFANDALCFFDARSRALTFSRPGHGRIDITVDNFSHWGIWSRPGAPFLCIEAWSGHGDPEGFDGDIRTKPSMTLLAPGMKETYRTVYSFVQAG